MSSFDFSDPVRRRVITAGFAKSMWGQTMLSSRFTSHETINGNDYLVSGVIPYEVELPTQNLGDFQTFGVEGGNGVLRLGAGKNEEQIYKAPCQIFFTDDEVTLHNMRKGRSIYKKAVNAIAQSLRYARVDHWLDQFILMQEKNTAAGTYPDMTIDVTGTGLTYANTSAMVRLFPGSLKAQLRAWAMHTDMEEFLGPIADTSPSPGTIKWIKRGAPTADQPQGQILMHNIPVEFYPYEDKLVKKDYADYTRRALRTGDEGEYVYRTFLMSDETMIEHIGYSPTMKTMDTAPVPPGTSGFPPNGQPSGVTMFLALLFADYATLPRDGWDRMGSAMLIHDGNVED